MTTHTIRQLSKSSKPLPVTSTHPLFKSSESTSKLFGNDSANMSNAAPSASIALINKIRAIESRKKHLATMATTTTNSLTGTSNIQQMKGFGQSNLPTITLTQQPKPSALVHDLQKEHIVVDSRQSKTSTYASNESFANKDATVKVNPYADKITDQMFFDRSYRLKSGANPLSRSKHSLNDESDENQSGDYYYVADANRASAKPRDIKSGSVFNKLKMLKKRNFIKKLGIVNQVSIETSTTDMRASRVNVDLFNGQSASKSNRNSNISDELNKRYSTNLNSSYSHHMGSPIAITPSSSKAKSENYVYELINKTQKTLSNSVKTLFTDRAQRQHISKTIENAINRSVKAQAELRKEENKKPNHKTEYNNMQANPKIDSSSDDDDANDPFYPLPNVNHPAKTKTNPYHVQQHNYHANEKSNKKQYVFHPDQTALQANSTQPIRVSVKIRDDLNFDINKEFERLYFEDEYFIEVHRKCSEWMNKHVVPNMPRILEKARKKY